jgi:HEAT repeat protein
MAAVVGLAALAGCAEKAGDVESKDRSARLQGVRQLAAEDSAEAVARIERAASHPDALTAIEAVRVLGASPRPQARQALRKVIAEEPRAPVRREAVIFLGQRPKDRVGDEDLEVLRRVVVRDPDPRVRSDAAAALGTVGGLADVKLLVDVATTDEDLLVQSRAVRAIEDLLDLRFKYDSKAPAAEREAALRRVRDLAPAIAEKYMKYHPKGRTGP